MNSPMSRTCTTRPARVAVAPGRPRSVLRAAARVGLALVPVVYLVVETAGAGHP